MAAPTEVFSTITTSQVDADSPVDETLMGAIRGNLINLNEQMIGPSTAPVYTAAQAHDHDGVNSKFVASVADGTITPIKMSTQTVGDYEVSANDTLRTTTNSTFIKIKETKIAKGGSYRIKFTLGSGSTGGIGGGPQARIYRNSSAIGILRATTSTTGVEFSEDLSGFSSGDLIQIFARATAAGTITPPEVSNFRLYGEDPGDFGSLFGF